MRIKTKFLNEHGYDSDLKRAKKVFNTENEYFITNVRMGNWMTYLEFEGIDGCWNSAMFDVDYDELKNYTETEHTYLRF